MRNGTTSFTPMSSPDNTTGEPQGSPTFFPYIFPTLGVDKSNTMMYYSR